MTPAALRRTSRRRLSTMQPSTAGSRRVRRPAPTRSAPQANSPTGPLPRTLTVTQMRWRARAPSSTTKPRCSWRYRMSTRRLSVRTRRWAGSPSAQTRPSTATRLPSPCRWPGRMGPASPRPPAPTCPSYQLCPSTRQCPLTRQYQQTRQYQRTRQCPLTRTNRSTRTPNSNPRAGHGRCPAWMPLRHPPPAPPPMLRRDRYGGHTTCSFSLSSPIPNQRAPDTDRRGRSPSYVPRGSATADRSEMWLLRGNANNQCRRRIPARRAVEGLKGAHATRFSRSTGRNRRDTPRTGALVFSPPDRLPPSAAWRARTTSLPRPWR